MISIAIVEDEAIERIALRQLLEESIADVQICWTAENGQDALEKWQNQQPDIMIVDISMPVMNGLELCKQLSARNYPGIIIINTAYSLFNYAREAMRHGAFDYLVKPSAREEWVEAIGRSIVEIERRRHEQAQQQSIYRQMSVAQKYTNAFLIRSMSYGEDLSSHLSSLGWPLGDQFGIHVLYFSQWNPDSRGHQSLAMAHSVVQAESFPGVLTILDADGEDSLVMLVQSAQPLDAAQWHVYLWAMALHWRQRFGAGSCIISDRCPDPLALTAYYKAVCAAAPGSGEYGICMPACAAFTMKKRSAQKLRQGIIRLFYDGKLSRCRELLRGSLQTQDSNCWELAGILLDAIVAYRKELPAPRFWQGFLCAPTPPDVDAFLDWADALVQACMDAPEAPMGNSMIDYIYCIMRQEFNQNLTQVSIAERLGLTPAYFSKMFKQRTGENFVNALTRIRIEHALHMLRQNPDISIEELTDACGLSSKTYFCEVFHKCTGMTVRQYAKKLRSNPS